MASDLNLFDKHFDDLMRDNFIKLIPISVVINILISYVDYLIAERNFLLYFSLRAIFSLPAVICFIAIKKGIFKDLRLHLHVSMFFIGLGVSITSYFLGGLESDYYFALIIISFLQFTFFPSDGKAAFFSDILLITIFMCLNTIPFDYDKKLLIKQLTNISVFTIFKSIALYKAENILYRNFESRVIESHLLSNEEVRRTFSELCRLVSNPIMISIALTKKSISKTDNTELEALLDRSLSPQIRIQTMVKKVLDLEIKESLSRELEAKSEKFQNQERSQK